MEQDNRGHSVQRIEMLDAGFLSGLEIRDWLLRFIEKEISNLDAISLSNCPKLSDNPRIKTVEYNVIGRGPVSIEGQKEVGCHLRLCNLAANTENAPDPFSCSGNYTYYTP